MNRNQRSKLARQTVEIVEQGRYSTAEGMEVDLQTSVARCLESTRSFTPEDLVKVEAEKLREPGSRRVLIYRVSNETTLAGARSLVASGQHSRVAVLNFASARNPGGGFLSGSQAQEESLARSSALYASLLRFPDYYEFHRQQASLLYSDRMILSPDCPVFRDDDGTLLAQPYLVTFITSAAPNAGALAENQPKDLFQIPETLRRRASKVLALALHAGADALVLGAWGCGVFRNEPALVADTFRRLLKTGGPFENRFGTLRFSVLDQSQGMATFAAFADAFGTAD